jgi:hypothetical protein
MNPAIAYIIARLGEPSTWRGIFALLTALGIAIEPEKAAAITGLGLAAIGVVNVFKKDAKKLPLIAAFFLPLALTSCATTADGTKTFLGVDSKGWSAIGLDVGKAAVSAAAPAYLGQRVSSKSVYSVQP